MKKVLLLINFLAVAYLVNSQCPNNNTLHELTGNQVKALILNGGDLFWDGDDGWFHVPVDAYPDEPRSTIFTAGLWMGGKDSAGKLKLAAQIYGYDDDSKDYAPGPLNPENGLPYDDFYCQYYDRIWVVDKQDIEAHLADYEDNGEVYTPLESIYAWPGNKNPWFYQFNDFPLHSNPNGWAPFHDKNGDNIYQPHLGEYPHPPHVIHNLHPAQISWTIFNDYKVHQESEALPIQAEVQLAAWNFDCFGNHVLNHTVFTSHKIINRAQEPIDSFFVGLRVDFDLGCPSDDYLGSSPENDGFLVYNSDNLDGESSPFDCYGIPTYANNPPAQSITFLNQSLDKFIWYAPSPGCVGPPGEQYPPNQPEVYYNFLKGLWNTGTPIHKGGSGYATENIDTTNWVFPDNPNDSTGWSLYTLHAPNGDRSAVGSTYIGKLEPNEATRLDMAFTYHGYNSLDYLGSANQAYIEMAEMQQMYDTQFNGWCEGIATNTVEPNRDEIQIFPNPSNDYLNIQSENLQIDQLEIYNSNGQLFYKEHFQLNTQIDLTDFQPGIYFIHLHSIQGIIYEKFVVSR